MSCIFHKKKIGWLWCRIFDQNYNNCIKRGEDILIEQWSFPGWKYRLCQEKKNKIALLNETVFIVKHRCKGWKIRFTNICGPLTWIKYLQHIRGFNSSPWFLLWFDIVKIMMISLCFVILFCSWGIMKVVLYGYCCATVSGIRHHGTCWSLLIPFPM